MKGKRLFNSFKIRDFQFVGIFAGNSKLGLLNSLAKETVFSGYNVIIISIHHLPYPIEGEVVLADEPQILFNSTKSKEPQVYYLAGAITNDLLEPLSFSKINEIISKSYEQCKVFIYINNLDQISKFPTQTCDNMLMICEVNYNLLREVTETLAIKNKKSKEQSYSKNIEKMLNNLIATNCPVFKSVTSSKDKICYIGQVKSMFDQNLVLPLARKIKEDYNCNVFLGYIQDYFLKEV
ncbi:MAG: hypothetical protein JXR46_04365 [Calditrichaceae bacterium]|nr:hypothetical protein [Calditrichaceae bacterium]MBN2708260.1 hypothetical protein [Calditrichaceae bacterium]RQV95187.1 MAG: hypothetical protein EH224_08140 [Calditrichota bacterium]